MCYMPIPAYTAVRVVSSVRIKLAHEYEEKYLPGYEKVLNFRLKQVLHRIIRTVLIDTLGYCRMAI